MLALAPCQLHATARSFRVFDRSCSMIRSNLTCTSRSKAARVQPASADLKANSSAKVKVLIPAVYRAVTRFDARLLVCSPVQSIEAVKACLLPRQPQPVNRCRLMARLFRRTFAIAPRVKPTPSATHVDKSVFAAALALTRCLLPCYWCRSVTGRLIARTRRCLASTAAAAAAAEAVDEEAAASCTGEIESIVETEITTGTLCATTSRGFHPHCPRPHSRAVAGRGDRDRGQFYSRGGGNDRDHHRDRDRGGRDRDRDRDRDGRRGGHLGSLKHTVCLY